MTEVEVTNATEPELTDEQYHAIWRELEQQFPVPTWDEVKPEWQWVHGRMEDGTLDPEYKYGGLHVAIYNRQVVGTDVNPLRLRTRLSRELGVHPERMVITYFYPA